MKQHYRGTYQTPGLDHSTPEDSKKLGSLQWNVEVAESFPEVETVLRSREPHKFINYYVGSGNGVPSGSDLTLDGPGSVTEAAADGSDTSTSEDGDVLAVHLFYPYASTEVRSQTIHHPISALRSGLPAASMMENHVGMNLEPLTGRVYVFIVFSRTSSESLFVLLSSIPYISVLAILLDNQL